MTRVFFSVIFVPLARQSFLEMQGRDQYLWPYSFILGGPVTNSVEERPHTAPV